MSQQLSEQNEEPDSAPSFDGAHGNSQRGKMHSCTAGLNKCQLGWITDRRQVTRAAQYHTAAFEKAQGLAK